MSVPTDVNNFKVAVSKDTLVIVAYPNYIYEYSLEHLYVFNMVSLTKILSMQGMKIQLGADV